MYKHLWSFITGLIFVSVGVVICAFEFMNYDISYNNVNKNEIEYKTYEFYINNNEEINFNIEHSKDIKVIEDNTLDNKVIVVYPYLKEYQKVEKREYINEDNKEINVFATFSNNKSGKKFFDRIIKDLKNKKVYNYFYGSYGNVKVYINPEYKDMVDID